MHLKQSLEYESAQHRRSRLLLTEIKHFGGWVFILIYVEFNPLFIPTLQRRFKFFDVRTWVSICIPPLNMDVIKYPYPNINAGSADVYW